MVVVVKRMITALIMCLTDLRILCIIDIEARDMDTNPCTKTDTRREDVSLASTGDVNLTCGCLF